MLPWFRMSEGQTTAAIAAAQRFAAKEAAIDALIGAGGANYIHQATEEISNAQIKALPTTGIQIADAPGPNRLIELVTAEFVTHFEAGVYAASADSSWQLFLGAGNSYVTGVVPMDGKLTITTSVTTHFPIGAMGPGGGTFDGVMRASGYLTADVVNGGVYIKDWWGGVSDYTLGHEANTAIISIAYLVRDISTGLLVAA